MKEGDLVIAICPETDLAQFRAWTSQMDTFDHCTGTIVRIYYDEEEECNIYTVSFTTPYQATFWFREEWLVPLPVFDTNAELDNMFGGFQ
jgi:hypothetical protein